LLIEVIEVDGIKKLRLSGRPTALPDEVAVGTNTGGLVSFLIELDDAEGRHAEQSIAFRILEPPAPMMMPGGTNGGGGCGCNAASPPTGSMTWLMPLFLLRRRRR
jgi:uncharacterized protein (TIGR03382 family)